MTRKKKSRKGGPLAPAKNPLQARKVEEKSSVHQGKGHKAGSRHSAGKHGPDTKVAGAKSSDPRHGSKKPVSLVDPNAQQATNAPGAVSAHSSTAKLEAELTALQNDTKLQGLLNQLEQDAELSETELAYVDKCTERFQQLAEALGLELDDEDDDEDDDWDDERA